MSFCEIRHTMNRGGYNGEMRVTIDRLADIRGLLQLSYFVEGRDIGLSAGLGDDISIMSSGFNIIVLSVNRRIPYVGMEVFKMETLRKEEELDVFFQEGQVYENISNFDDMTDTEILKYVYDEYAIY